ncbi:MAG: hypothetical protein WD336_02810, partial [Trueperaceae bacterium]
LLWRRAAFAGTARFRLFEAEGPDGPLPDLYAFVNGPPSGATHLVLVHNRYAEVDARLRRTVPFVPPGGGEPVVRTFAEAVGLEGGPDRFVRWWEQHDGLERLARLDAWLRDGFAVHLRAYEARVLLDLRSFRDADGRWAELHAELSGRPVPDLDESLRLQALAPLHRAFARLASAGEASAGDASAGDANTGEASVVDESAAHESAADATASVGRAADPAVRTTGGAREPAADEAASDGTAQGEPATGGVDAANVAASDAPAGDAAASDARTHADEASTGGPSEAEALRAFQTAWNERPPVEGPRADETDRTAPSAFDADRFGAIASRAEGAGVPSRAWCRAWAIAASFDAPRATAEAYRLDRAVARRLPHVTDEVGPEAWAILWRASLPTAGASGDDASASDAPASDAPASDAPASDAPVGDAAADVASGDVASADAASAGDASVEVAKVDRATGTGEARVHRTSDVDDVAAFPAHADVADVAEADAALASLTTDGPVAEVLGVHHHDGTTWFRQEGFRAWRDAWLAVRALSGATETQLERWRRRFVEAERRSGYRFDALTRNAA